MSLLFWKTPTISATALAGRDGNQVVTIAPAAALAPAPTPAAVRTEPVLVTTHVPVSSYLLNGPVAVRTGPVIVTTHVEMPVRDTVMRVEGLTKRYTMGDVTVHALGGVSFELQRGDLVAIMGPSGSGKSTLMNVLGCLDQPTTGTYWLDGLETSKLSDDQLAEARNRKIGFVFQQFNLLARTSALEQVELPLLYRGGLSASQRRERAREALAAVGLADRTHHRPTELSGGQQQRVAIARALVSEPAIILADEPTGALATRTSEEVMAIFQRLNRERGITIVFVTHEADIARYTRRILHIRDGKISHDERVPTELQLTARPVHEAAA